ncbi:MAG TPA: hypothetical protein PL063_03600 [Candidatus Cloacimonadota bacterium]|jgi:hypothetical protein|nr:hypothetical protein [Candidatus Cloacimonadota bacterium]
MKRVLVSGANAALLNRILTIKNVDYQDKVSVLIPFDNIVLYSAKKITD